MGNENNKHKKVKYILYIIINNTIYIDATTFRRKSETIIFYDRCR